MVWVALLLIADGLEVRTLVLVLTGGVGILYTIIAAVAPRTPENWRSQLELVRNHTCIVSSKVTVALIWLEIAYGGVGLALRSEHFSGTMSPKEKAF